MDQPLSETDNNLELSIQLLNQMRLSEPQFPVQHAQELVSAFQYVRSRDEAVHLTAEVLQRYHQLACEQEAHTLRQQIDVLSKDNEVLKKAVAHLSIKLSDAEQKGSDSQLLREELQRERLNNYVLRLHLEQATTLQSHEHRSPDVF